ncbi:MAG: mycofactocin biosynthesis peptidyl-dipeptidase MftE [Nocardioidaceae bacterium]
MRGTVAPTAASLGLGQQRWPRIEPGQPLLLVPVGSVEQHGPHLPLATDTMVANAVTRAAAERLDATGTRVLVAPSVNYGASGEHQGFPGTVSIGHEALFLLLVELARSACHWSGGIVFVNGHGGNTSTLLKVVELLRYEDRAVAWTSTALADADAHAGETETSLLRFLAPWSVRVDLMAAGATEPVSELMPRLREEGVRGVSPNGVLGDPTTSSPERGRELFQRLVRNLVAELTALDVTANGRLGGARQPLGTP